MTKAFANGQSLASHFASFGCGLLAIKYKKLMSNCKSSWCPEQ
jgi:hypothetical protein